MGFWRGERGGGPKEKGDPEKLPCGFLKFWKKIPLGNPKKTPWDTTSTSQRKPPIPLPWAVGNLRGMTVMEKLSPIDMMKWGPGPQVLSNRNKAINKTKILFWTIYIIHLLLENYSPRTSSPRPTCGVKSAHRRDLTAGYSLQTEQLKAVGSGIFIRNNTKTCYFVCLQVTGSYRILVFDPGSVLQQYFSNCFE